MSITTRCRRCGRTFQLDRAAILAGRWRLCSACRDSSPPGGAAGPSPDPRPVPAGAALVGPAKEA